MNTDDEIPFTALIAKTWRIYGKTLGGDDVAIWFELLADVPLATLTAAFHRHLRDPDAGQYPPKPADIIRQLNAAQPGATHHPGPEEAWGLLLRFVNDERETGLYTEPMRHAWEACTPILKAGDEVGARMCFLETYKKALRRAVEARQPPKWSLSMGTDPERRKMALEAAVERRQISADYARSLLPAPPASLEAVAGLLESAAPREPLDHPPLRERLKALAAQLRADPAEALNRAIQAEQDRHATINARKAEMINRMDARLRRAA